MSRRMSWLIGLCLVPALQAQEWTRFRGPNGSGIGQIRGFPERIKDFAWKIDLPGAGHSSPVVWGDRLFVTSGIEETGGRVVQCLDTRTGKQLWRRDFAGSKHRKHQDNSFASSTPAVNDKVLVLTWADPKAY